METLAPALLAITVALAVVGPWLQKGWLLLLDWTPGPHIDVSRNVFGLQRSLTAGAPFSAAIAAGARSIGAAIGWVPAAAAIALSVYGMGRLVGGRATRWVPAALLYGCNPVVYERLAVGQFSYLLGYSLLPLAARAGVIGIRRGRIAGPALWLTALTACAVHFAWIGGVLFVAITIAATGERKLGAVRWLIGTAFATTAATAYLWLPMLGGAPPLQVTGLDLVAYRTSGDALLGLYPNVAGLYGFWRVGEFRLPKEDVVGWPFILAAILLVVGVGIRATWRQPGLAATTRSLCLTGACGYALALGDQGPVGAVFRFAFHHVPSFSVMREPQKFVALLALVYAYAFGHGAEQIVRTLSRPAARRLAAAVLVVAPVVYVPTLAGGLAGRIHPVHYPASWRAADRTMGAGDGRVLFLPWHQYLHFGFSNRVVATPADNFFRRDVIVADNVEVAGLRSGSTDPRSAYIEFLLSQGPHLCAFGDLLAPLGVEYVALARVVDHASYGWLGEQADLEVVMDRPDIVVYRNLRYRGLGYRVRDTLEADDWGQLVDESRAGRVSEAAVIVRSSVAGTSSPGTCDPPRPSVVRPAATRRSPVAYEVEPGQTGTLVLATPFDRSWSLHGEAPRRLAGHAMAFPAGRGGGVARFGHWTLVRTGYQTSVLAVLALAVLLFRGRRRRLE